MASSSPEASGAEKRFGGSFFGAEWLQRGAELATCVCVVRLNNAPVGTAFLVGPDLVLTCRHVVAPVLDGQRPLTELRFVFDHARGTDGLPMSADDFGAAICHAQSPEDDLDFALLRLDRTPGRGWVEISPTPWLFPTNPGLSILQHPNGERQQLAFDPDATGKLSPDGKRVLHKIETDAGSSGSPVFGGRSWTPVALHQGWTGDWNKGIPLALIAAIPDVADRLRAAQARAPRTRRARRRVAWIAAAVLPLAASVVVWQLWPTEVSIRLQFYVDNPKVPQPVSGTLDVYLGTAERPVPLEQSTGARIDGVKSKYLGTELRATLSSRQFEIDPSTTPTLSDDAPILVRVRRRRISYSCRDAIYDLRVTGMDAADAGPEPTKKDIAIRAEFWSKTPHPIWLTAFKLEILTKSMVPAFVHEFDDRKIELPPQQGTEGILDILIPRDEYGLLQAGLEFQMGGRCQNPDEPGDFGPYVTSDPWSKPASVDRTPAPEPPPR